MNCEPPAEVLGDSFQQRSARHSPWAPCPKVLVYSICTKDGFYVFNGSLSGFVITPVLPIDLQNLKYLLSRPQRKCVLSLLLKDKQASGMEVQVAVAAGY